MMNTIAKKVSIISAVVEEYLVTTKYILKNNTNVLYIQKENSNMILVSISSFMPPYFLEDCTF